MLDLPLALDIASPLMRGETLGGVSLNYEIRIVTLNEDKLYI